MVVVRIIIRILLLPVRMCLTIRMLVIGFILYVLPILVGWAVVWLEAIKIRLMGD